MTGNQHAKHIISIVLLAAGAAAVVLLTDSPWAHAAWAPAALVFVRYLVAALGGGPGPTAAAIVLLTFIGLGQSCAHAPAPSADCRSAALALLGEAGSALVQGNWEDAVNALVSDPHGGMCAVEEALSIIAKQSAANAASTGDNLEALKAERAKAWLAAHGVQ